MSEKKRIYFPGLHALRFFAATFVIFHHVEQYKSWAGISSSWGHSMIDALGHQPVSFFFVLSGFLITYLLLVENDRNSRINIPQFYWRRILRIWPLYFVIVGFALFFVPIIAGDTFTHFENPLNSTLAVVSLLLFLPNLLRIGFPDLVGGNQLWSVGIEEQFYLFWPLLVRRFVKNIIPFLLAFIAIKFLVHALLIEALGWTSNIRLQQIEHLYRLFPVEQMAIGGLGAALLFHQKNHIVKLMAHPMIGITAVALSVWSGFNGSHHWVMTYFQGVIFTAIIFTVIHNKRIYSMLENRIFNYLGNISYGIYMWHTLAITLVIVVFDQLSFEIGAFANVALTISSISLTLILSHFSYRFLEKPFLKLKSKAPETLVVKTKLRKQTYG